MLPTILEEDEEAEEDAPVFGRKCQDRDMGYSSWTMKSQASGPLADIEEESEDGMDWDDETTLVALLQDE